MESQYVLNAAPQCRSAGDGATWISALRQAGLAWWYGVLTRRACQRTATLLSELDEHVLRDIGAPAWALRESAALREVKRGRRNQWLSSN